MNLHHHPAAFTSLQEAFDPVANAEYAARFLASLHAASRSDDWMEAVGFYHSHSPDEATSYRARVQAVMAMLAVPALPSFLPVWTASQGRASRVVASALATRPTRPPTSGTRPEDWMRLAAATPRQGWRLTTADALSSDRALALAQVLDHLAGVAR